VRAGRLLFDGLDGSVDGLDAHHHAGAAAERVVVDAPVLVQRVVAQVVHGDLHQAFLLRPLENAFAERGDEHPRK